MSDDELEQTTTEREAKLRGLQPFQVRANRAVSDQLMRDIVNDSRGGVTQRSSLARLPRSEPRAPSGGTVEVKPPPGIDYIDRMCEAQSRTERAAAIRQRIENEWIEALMGNKTPHKAATEYNPFDKKRLGHDDDE
jgi:hypothetical protein